MRCAAHRRRRAARPDRPSPRARSDRPGRGSPVRGPGHHRAARHRAGDRLPLAARAGRRTDGRGRRPGALRGPHRWSSSSRCGAPCSPSRATCCPLPGGAPRPGSPTRNGRRIAKDAVRGGLADDGEALARRTRAAAVLDRLADGSALPPRQLRERAARAGGQGRLGSGQGGGRRVAGAPGARPSSGAEALIVRGRNDGHWRMSRPAWTLMSAWLGEVPEPPTADEGYAELVRRWLRTFGPGTETDIVWWLGATKTAVRRGAGRRRCRRGVPGRRRHRLGAARRPRAGRARVEPWAALLPVLDPTVMGWKQRDFYLEPARAVPLRHQRQRRHHRLVGRPGRRLLGPGRGRAWCEVVLREDVGARGRAAALDARRSGSPPGSTGSGSTASTRRCR